MRRHVHAPSSFSSHYKLRGQTRGLKLLVYEACRYTSIYAEEQLYACALELSTCYKLIPLYMCPRTTSPYSYICRGAAVCARTPLLYAREPR